MSIKTWLNENKNSNLTIEEIDKNVKSLEEKYNVNIPNDLKEFWLSLNGYCFQGCDMISSLTETEERGISSVAEETKTFKTFVEDWEIDYEMADFIVVATIYEHGYVIYLNNIKKYVLIEDISDDFVLDGSDEKLLQFNSIFDVLVYFDYNTGDKVFEKEYQKLFSEELKKEEEYNNQVAKRHSDKINELEEKVKNNKAISFKLILDNNYLETIKKEHKEMSYSIIFGDYEINKEFKIYINLKNKQLGVSYNNKIETHNQYGMFGMNPPVITEITHKENYFVVKTDRDFVEPIIIFDSWLNKDQTKKLKSLFKKSIFNFFKF
jgi:hypothetical protein